MDNNEYWARKKERNAKKYPNITATGLDITDKTTGHGESDDFVYAEALEKYLADCEAIEIEGKVYLLVAPFPVRKPMDLNPKPENSYAGCMCTLRESCPICDAAFNARSYVERKPEK